MVAISLMKILFGMAGYIRDDRGLSIPRSESNHLKDVDDRNNGNDRDDTMSKVPCKCITRSLQAAVIQKFPLCFWFYISSIA